METGAQWSAYHESPFPEVIVFMTDGAMEQRDNLYLSGGIIAKAKQKNITINTVNMMVTDPEAMESLTDTAELPSSCVTMVGQGGKVSKSNLQLQRYNLSPPFFNILHPSKIRLD